MFDKSDKEVCILDRNYTLAFERICEGRNGTRCGLKAPTDLDRDRYEAAIAAADGRRICYTGGTTVPLNLDYQ